MPAAFLKHRQVAPMDTFPLVCAGKLGAGETGKTGETGDAGEWQKQAVAAVS